MITSRSRIKLGLLPTHLRFVGGLVPNEQGELPKDTAGDIVLLSGIRRLVEACPVKIETIQVPFFANVRLDEMQEVLAGLHALELETQLILMLGGGNPMVAEDEDAFVSAAVPLVRGARDLGSTHLASTSLEPWMLEGATRRDGADFDAAVAQIARVHSRIYHETELASSNVVHWHIEFLREGEFTTFTDMQRGWAAVRAINDAVGKPFFQVLVDAAHCGDSKLSIQENAETIQQIAAGDELGIFHASAKTTRGCFSTDDGWIAAMLAACVATGKLEYALAEVFAHDDDALAGLRSLDPRHGADTRDGRTYDEVVIDGIVNLARRLNNFVQRGLLPAREP